MRRLMIAIRLWRDSDLQYPWRRAWHIAGKWV